MGMQRFLYIVNGLGMGNSTRCHSIIQHHSPMLYDVDILTSGNGILYFQNVNRIGQVEVFESLTYAKDQNGDLSIFGSILRLPKLAVRYARNVRKLRKVIRKGDYSAIIIDSDYSAYFVKKFAGIPIIAINNADMVVAECKERRPLPASIKMQYWIERLDNLFHRKVPDHVLSPTLEKAGKIANIVHLPPMIRSQLKRRAPSENVKNILVMLSGSDFGTSTDFLNLLALPPEISINVIGREGLSDQQVTYHGKVIDNTDLLNAADLMVINAGFSAISEAVVLGRPSVVIPVANHAEQYVNARLISELGLGVEASADTVGEQISNVIENYAAFLAKHQEFDCGTHGALIGAQAIEAWAVGKDFPGPDDNSQRPADDQ